MVERFYEKSKNLPRRLFHFFIVIFIDVTFLYWHIKFFWRKRFPVFVVIITTGNIPYGQTVVQRCFVKKSILRNLGILTKFTGKHLCQNLFFNKTAGLRPATLLKKRPWHTCFPVIRHHFVYPLQWVFFNERDVFFNFVYICFLFL